MLRHLMKALCARDTNVFISLDNLKANILEINLAVE
jgi:hypothetical protein